MSKYKAIVTTAGAAKIAAASAGGKQLKITHMAVGDGNGTLPTPNPEQIKLVNEKYRATLNTLTIDRTIDNHIIAELIIPANIGGFWLREMGLYDENGALIAVSNMAESYKPQLNEGSGRTQTLRMVLIVSSTEAIQIIAGGDTVLATRDFVDDAIKEHEKTRNHPDASTTAKGFVQLSSATTSSDETKAATPKAIKDVNDASVKKADNLSDLKDKAEARKNLALGTAATKNVGTASGNVMEMGTAGLGVGPVHKDDAYGNIAEFFRITASSANRPGNNSYGGVRLPIDGGPTTSYVVVGADMTAWIGRSQLQANGVAWARVYTTLFKPTADDVDLGNVGNFMAVQQGGGANQSNNKVYIGWGNDGILRCTVDKTDLGQIFTTKSPPTAAETKAYPITGGNLRGSLNALGGVGTQGGAFFIRNADGVQVASISANSNGSISVYSDVTGRSFGIGSDGGFFTSSGVGISESGQRVYSPNNPPPSQTDKSVSGDGWWYRDSRTGIIFQGGFTSGSADPNGAIDRIPLNIAVPNRLLFVSTIIRNYAQGYQTTWNPQTRNLSGERNGFDWIHGSNEREVYWMAIGY
ncbi:MULTISPECIES: phage tail protein [Serratia]|uniref:phage tail protein n=1 Tax=Serratia TaxID=613 RepID=UPI0011F0E6E6|nr:MULTISPECIES: phage tail protein [Serratia]NRN13177.1 hypothetical protein [Serratia marcescens]NRN35781.1 hypothetical protein [Serratia marcescens]